MKHTPFADTSHLKVCRLLWLEHLQTCDSCSRARMWNLPIECLEGKALKDEYIQPHYANLDLEQVTATEANQ